MYRLITIGIISIILYVAVTSFDSLIYLKVDATEELEVQNGIAHAEEKSLKGQHTEQKYVWYQPILVTNEHAKIVKKNTGPTIEQLKKLTETFFQELIQATNNEYEVIRYTNKNKLKEHLLEYATLNVVSYFVDGLYEERDGKLLIIPMDTPPWINQDKPAEIIKVSENEVILTQTNQSELHGNYKISISFKKKDGGWIMTNVQIGNAI